MTGRTIQPGFILDRERLRLMLTAVSTLPALQD